MPHPSGMPGAGSQSRTKMILKLNSTRDNTSHHYPKDEASALGESLSVPIEPMVPLVFALVLTKPL